MIVVRFFPRGVTERGKLSGAHPLHEHINFKADFKKDGSTDVFQSGASLCWPQSRSTYKQIAIAKNDA